MRGKGYLFGILILIIAGGAVYGASVFGAMMEDNLTIYKNELNKSHVLNQSFQQAMSNLILENERLKNELDKIENNKAATDNNELSDYKANFAPLKEVWRLCKNGETALAKEKIKNIDVQVLDENAGIMYDMINDRLAAAEKKTTKK